MPAYSADQDLPSPFQGLRVIENVGLTDTETIEEPRPWRQRLFSRPWRPWVKTQTRAIQVPSRKYYVIDDHSVVMHPALREEFRRAVEKANERRA